MNKSGQVLVVFVLMLPILLFIVAALMEVGDLLIYQHKLENHAKEIVSYGVENLEDLKLKEKLETLNEKNLDGKARITITNKSVSVSIKRKKESIFPFLTLPLTVEFTYKGTTKDGKINIVKE